MKFNSTKPDLSRGISQALVVCLEMVKDCLEDMLMSVQCE